MASFFLLLGREKASPWKETERLLVEVMSIFVAADISVAGEGEGRRRSTDWERLGRNDGGLFEFVSISPPIKRVMEGERERESLSPMASSSTAEFGEREERGETISYATRVLRTRSFYTLFTDRSVIILAQILILYLKNSKDLGYGLLLNLCCRWSKSLERESVSERPSWN